MAGTDDTREFDRIVARLRADDPGFVDRVTPDPPTGPAPAGPADGRRPRRRLRAGLLGIVALFALVLGGWTGLIIAIVITVWAARLVMADRPDRDG